MTALPVVYQPDLPSTLAKLEEEAADYAARARATNTVKAYRSDWRAFAPWC